MAPIYYQIELSARLLTVLLLVLAVLLIMAFAFGYGAAWSVLSMQGATVRTPAPIASLATPSPTVQAVVVPTVVQSTVSGPAPTRTSRPQPTATKKAAASRPPSATKKPVASKPTRAARTSAPTTKMFWVQVLAASRRAAVGDAGKLLESLGFGKENQRRVEAPVAGGGVLYKLRVGPFPDRASADRVAERMRISGFPDAWVVVP